MVKTCLRSFIPHLRKQNEDSRERDEKEVYIQEIVVLLKTFKIKQTL